MPIPASWPCWIIGCLVHGAGLEDCAPWDLRWDKRKGVLTSGGRSDRVTRYPRAPVRRVTRVKGLEL